MAQKISVQEILGHLSPESIEKLHKLANGELVLLTDQEKKEFDDMAKFFGHLKTAKRFTVFMVNASIKLGALIGALAVVWSTWTGRPSG